MLQDTKSLFQRLLREERGQGTTEYTIIIAVVVIGLAGVLVAFRGKLTEYISGVSNNLDAGGTKIDQTGAAKPGN